MFDCVLRTLALDYSANQWPGMIASSVLIGLLLAALASPTILALYGRRVAALMRVGGDGSACAAPNVDIAPARPPRPEVLAAALAGPRRSLTVLAAAALAYALAHTLILFAAEGIAHLPLRTGYTVATYLLPTLPVVLLAALPPGAHLRSGVPAILAFGTAVNLVPVMQGQPLAPALQVFAANTLLPLAMFLTLGSRRLRTVLPVLAVAGLLLVLALQYGFVTTAGIVLCSRDAALMTPAKFAGAAVALALLALAALALRAIGRAYAARRFSDIEFQSDAWLLVLSTFAMTSLIPALGLASVLAFLPWFMFRALRRLLSARLVRPPQPPQRLLLLRVFAGDRRAERLLDDLAHRWRYIGPIRMIGGSDLARAYIDPQELLDFLSFRVQGLFVADGADLARRLAGFAERTDPDGRYRIDELFCHDHTWRPAVQALIGSAEAILMDLRGFTSANRGCEYELGLLARPGIAERVVLLVDGSTKAADLDAVLARVGGSGLRRVRCATAPDVAGVLAALLHAG